MPRAAITTDPSEDHRLESPRIVYRAENQKTEIDLLELLFHWFHHIRLILLLALAGALLAAAYTLFLVTPIYEATAKLYVLSSGDSALNLSDLQIGSYLASDYIEVFKTWEVHEMVISNLKLPYTYSQIQSMLTIENPTDTRLIYITVRSPSAHEAAAIANEYANVAIKYIADTMSTEEPNIMSVALEPTNPATPNKTQNLLLGFMLGLVLAVGWITLRFVTDDTVKSVDDIRKYTNLPVLAVVPTYVSNAAPKKQKDTRKTK